MLFKQFHCADHIQITQSSTLGVVPKLSQPLSQGSSNPLLPSPMVAYHSGGASEASKVGGRCRPGTPLLMLIPSPHSGNPPPSSPSRQAPGTLSYSVSPPPPLPPWYSGVFLTLINCLLGILALHHGTPTLHHRLTPHR